LIVADPAAERQNLIRQIAKHQNLHSHLGNLERLMSRAALEALQQEQTQLALLIEQSRVAAESFASEPLHGVGLDVPPQLEMERAFVR